MSTKRVFLALALAFLAAAARADICDLPRRDLRGVTQKTWSAGNQRLVICAASETQIYVITTGNAGSRLIFVSDNTDWDYKAEPPNFTFTVFTWRSPEEPRVPLLRFHVFLTSLGAKQRSYFVLRGKPFSEERFQRYLQEFRDAANDEQRQRDLIYTMRDEGISRPRRALQLLRSLDAEGVIARELAGVTADLEFARDLPHAP